MAALRFAGSLGVGEAEAAMTTAHALRSLSRGRSDDPESRAGIPQKRARPERRGH